jgi:hypothetical protein
MIRHATWSEVDDPEIHGEAQVFVSRMMGGTIGTYPIADLHGDQLKVIERCDGLVLVQLQRPPATSPLTMMVCCEERATGSWEIQSITPGEGIGVSLIERGSLVVGSTISPQEALDHGFVYAKVI